MLLYSHIFLIPLYLFLFYFINLFLFIKHLCKFKGSKILNIINAFQILNILNILDGEFI